MLVVDQASKRNFCRPASTKVLARIGSSTARIAMNRNASDRRFTGLSLPIAVAQLIE